MHASQPRHHVPPQQPITLSLGANQSHGVRTLEEIEAEMREAFAAQRLQNQSPTQQQLYAQGHLRSASAQRHLPPQYTHAGTPPPRMHAQHPQHAQSPRFQQQHQHQQQHQQQIHLLQQQQQQMQLLELQELRDRQQRQELEYLQEQLRIEELERHRQQQARQQAQQVALLQHQRQASGGTPIGEMPYRRTPAHQRVGTPSRLQQPQPQPHQAQQQHLEVPFQQSMQYLPREIQIQQRLLAEMAQAEFLRSVQGSPAPEGKDEQEVHEMLRAQAMQKIMEAERMEEKRKRKLEKIRYMVRHHPSTQF